MYDISYMMGWFCLKGFLGKQPKKQKGSRVENGVVLRALEKARFEEKSPGEDILVYLRRHWEDLQQDYSVVEALKETKFVVTSADDDGDLYKPKDLFDPGDALLTSLFSANKFMFPGKRFASDGWLSILRKTGLQSTRDADAVLQCARRIEYLGAQSKEDQVSLELWSSAETLIETIFGNSALVQDQSFCSVFGKIACVPAEKGFPFNPGKTRVKRVVCSYSEAILLKDWALAWSVAPIVTKVPPDYSWRALQLRSPPSFTLVLDHLQYKPIDGTLTVSIPCLLAMEDATWEILKYLDTNWGTLSPTDVSKLSTMPFITASNGALLVVARSLVTHLNINICPIAHQLPSRYLPYVNTLKELGLHDTLSVSSAMKFLSRYRDNYLNPNELRAYIELLNFICNETEQQKLDRSNWESELHVPDIDCKLVRPNVCVYIDPFGSQYTGVSKPRLVHHDVSERLCLAFGIRKFSDVFVEELDCVEDLETVEEIGSVSLAAIRLKLLNKSFQVAVWSVANNFSSVTAGFKNPDFSTLERWFDSIAERLQLVKSIYTRFRCLDVSCASSMVPEWERESRLYYVDRSNRCMLIAEPPSYVRVLDLVTSVVSHVLGSPVPLPIGSLFLCPHNSETDVVNILELPSHEREMGTEERES